MRSIKEDADSFKQDKSKPGGICHRGAKGAERACKGGIFRASG